MEESSAVFAVVGCNGVNAFNGHHFGGHVVGVTAVGRYHCRYHTKHHSHHNDTSNRGKDSCQSCVDAFLFGHICLCILKHTLVGSVKGRAIQDFLFVFKHCLHYNFSGLFFGIKVLFQFFASAFQHIVGGGQRLSKFVRYLLYAVAFPIS